MDVPERESERLSVSPRTATVLIRGMSCTKVHGVEGPEMVGLEQTCNAWYWSVDVLSTLSLPRWGRREGERRGDL